MTEAYTNYDPEAERQAWRERHQEELREESFREQAQQMDANGVTERVTEIARTYPHLPSGVVYSAASNGLGPDEVKQIADRVAEIQSQALPSNAMADPRTGTISQVGMIPGAQGEDQRPERDTAQEDAPWWVDARDAAFRGLKKTVRNGLVLAMAPQQEIERLAESAFAADVRAQEAAGGSIVSDPVDYITTYSRELAGNLQATQDQSSTLYNKLRGDLGLAEEKDVGTGFFPVDEERRQTMERELQHPRIARRNQAHNFGPKESARANFGNVLLEGPLDFVEPGTWTHRSIKGAANTAFDIASDPVLFLDKPARAALAARKAGVPLTAKLSEMGSFGRMQQIGIAESTGLIPRQTVLPETFVDGYLKGSWNGNALRHWLAQTDSFEAIRQRLEDVRLSRKLADADDIDKVTRLLEENWARVDALDGKLKAPLGYRARKASTTLDRTVTALGRKSDELRNSPIGSKLFSGLDRTKRLGSWTALRRIPLDKPNQAVEQFRRFMQNAKLEKDLVHRRSREFADALLDGTRVEARKVYNRVTEDIADDLLKRGHDEDVVDQIRKRMQYGDPGNPANVGNRAYWGEVVAGVGVRNREIPGIGLAEKDVPMPKPHWGVEHADDYIELNAQLNVRRATGMLSRLAKVPGVRKAIKPTGWSGWSLVDLAWAGQKSLWMPLQLITRIAWPMRIVGEEQFRMWANGADGMFTNPMSYWAYTMGLKGNKSVLNEPLKHLETYQDAQTARMRNFLGDTPSSVRHRDWGHQLTGPMNERDAVRLWKIEYGKALKDDGAQKAAQVLRDPTQDVTDLAAWWKGTDNFDRVASSNRALVDDEAARAAGYASTDEAVEEYAQTMLDRVKYASGNDRELIDGIADRSIRGRDVDWGAEPKKVGNAMDEVLHEKSARVPETLPGPLGETDEVLSGNVLQRFNDEAIEKMWYTLGALPSNTFSRGPLYTQEYWRKMKELMPWMDEATKKKVMAQADEWLKDYDYGGREGIIGRLKNVGREAEDVESVAGLTDEAAEELAESLPKTLFESIRDVIGFKGHKTLYDELAQAGRSVQRFAGQGDDTGRLIRSLDEADMVAQDHALRKSNDLLYALHKRGHTAEALRLVFPFAEAWKEVGTRWLENLAKNPLITRKAQIVHDNAEDTGFIYTDPTSGDDYYAIPGANQVLNKLFFWSDTRQGELDVTATASSPLKAVNLFAGSVLPGVGPILQWPAGALMPEHPSWDSIRETVLPFGEMEGIRDVLPAYWNKALTAATDGAWDERMWNSTVADAMDALAYQRPEKYEPVEGDDKATVEEKAESLKEDALELADKMLWTRSLGQAIWISSPRIEFQFSIDEDQQTKREVARTVMGDDPGDLDSLGQNLPGYLSQQALTSYFYNLLSERDGNYHQAMREFTDTLGLNVDERSKGMGLLLEGKYDELGRRATSEAGEKWERANPDLIEKAPAILGYLAPEPEYRDAPMSAFFNRLKEDPNLVSKSPEEYFDTASHLIAWSIWEEQSSKVEGRNDKEARQWKQAWAQSLSTKFPGWRSGVATMAKGYTQHQKLDQLRDVIDHEAVQETEAGKGAAVWLEKLDMVISQIKEEEGKKDDQAVLSSLQQAKKHQSRRDWLRDWGLEAVRNHPEFAVFWKRELSKLVEPLPSEEAAQEEEE